MTKHLYIYEVTPTDMPTDFAWFVSDDTDMKDDAWTDIANDQGMTVEEAMKEYTLGNIYKVGNVGNYKITVEGA